MEKNVLSTVALGGLSSVIGALMIVQASMNVHVASVLGGLALRGATVSFFVGTSILWSILASTYALKMKNSRIHDASSASKYTSNREVAEVTTFSESTVPPPEEKVHAYIYFNIFIYI